MDFALTDEQRRIQETVRDFGEREVKPHAAAWDRDEAFPHAAVTQLATLGLLGCRATSAAAGRMRSPARS